MTKQLVLTLEFNVPHRYENNPLSQSFLNEHREQFKHDCYNVLQAFTKGERHSYKSAMNTGLSGDLRARVYDLRTVYGLSVSDEWIKTKGERRFKEYYMTMGDKAKSFEVIMSKIKKN